LTAGQRTTTLCAVTDLLQTVEPPEGPGVFHHTPGLSFVGQVVEGWERFIDRYQWDWFATFTFTERIHPEAADKTYRVWMSELQQAVAGKHYEKKPRDQVRWVRGLEWQKRGVIHFHALMYHRFDLNLHQRRKEWEAQWEHLTTAFCRIYPCDSSGAVRSYIAKYCGKGGEVDCSPNLPPVQPGRAAVRI
jgi:hypothetical protein